MTHYPSWIAADDDQAPQVEVDWGALQADWRTRPHTRRLVGETRAELANRVRAMVAEGLIGAEHLPFAEHLERTG